MEQFLKQPSLYANDVKREFISFIQSFLEDGKLKYFNLAKLTLINFKHTILFSFKDFFAHNPNLADLVFTNFYKYEPILNDALTSFMLELDKEHGRDDGKQEKYEVAFDSAPHEEDNSVRDLKCGTLGKLCNFKGTVTRTSEVRPQLVIGVFICKQCGTESYPVIQQFKYTEPKKCRRQNCDKGIWVLSHEKSQFADFQKIRVQEDPTKIPPGGMPRSIDVILRNDNTEKGQAGDICEIVGYLSVVPEIASMLKPGEKTQVDTRSHETRGTVPESEGIRGLKGIRDLSYKLIFCASYIKVKNNQFNDSQEEKVEDEDIDERNANTEKMPYDSTMIYKRIISGLTEMQVQTLKEMKNNPKMYEDISQSLFPSVYGHDDIKKALLIQLLGGVHKKTRENKINIRGDINILIVGDPSSAKSLFLKCINNFVPRSVYTNGKTTSAAGLTASVTRDENGNVGIEAGALMLADNGICCIDQFDKMDLKDQVAIHEAMEQQTISIAKAGVYATLNARTSILAAANPVLGRYDKSKSLKQNINLSAPIMSRFDLFFVVLDESNSLTDSHLSDFIINLHRGREKAVNAKYTAKEVKTYLSVAKKMKPRLTEQASRLLQRYYIDARSKDKNNANSSYRITVRHLQSVIRISEALAKLRLDFQVKPEYVKEAFRLLSCSILKIEKPPVPLNDDEESLRQNIEKMRLQERTDAAMDQQIRRQKELDSKPKQMKISHDIYHEIERNVIAFFNEKQSRHSRDQIQIDQQTSQGQLCSYLMSVNMERGLLSNMEEAESMEKLMNAVIRKLIKDQMLMVVEDDSDLEKRMVCIHPNYSQV